MTENRTAIDVSGRLKTVRLQVGVLRPTRTKLKACYRLREQHQERGYTVVTSEKNSSGICFFESVLSASPTRNDETNVVTLVVRQLFAFRKRHRLREMRWNAEDVLCAGVLLGAVLVATGFVLAAWFIFSRAEAEMHLIPDVM